MRYLVFVGADFHPSGMNDFVGRAATLDDAALLAASQSTNWNDWAEILDLNTGECHSIPLGNFKDPSKWHTWKLKNW